LERRHRSDELKAGVILTVITVAEGWWLLVNANHRLDLFLHYTGFRGKNAGLWGWVAAVVCTVLFLVYSARLPSVRSNFIRVSWLKILALTVAITAAFCEETIFRKLLMNALQNHGFGIVFQLAASGAAFGLAHAVWGLFRGSILAALRVVSVTGVLGLALASVYIVSDRIVAPCIVAHFLMNLFAEPGLVLSAVTGEMSDKSTVGPHFSVS
jgi:membrane protease YdiL (CAAX protease family)